MESHGIDSLLESIPIVESIPPLESIPSLESIPLLESIPNWNQLNCGMELELESLNSKKCPKSDSRINSTAGIITPLVRSVRPPIRGGPIPILKESQFLIPWPFLAHFGVIGTRIGIKGIVKGIEN